jgi:hypothetical protein
MCAKIFKISDYKDARLTDVRHTATGLSKFKIDLFGISSRSATDDE